MRTWSQYLSSSPTRLLPILPPSSITLTTFVESIFSGAFGYGWRWSFVVRLRAEGNPIFPNYGISSDARFDSPLVNAVIDWFTTTLSSHYQMHYHRHVQIHECMMKRNNHLHIRGIIISLYLMQDDQLGINLEVT